MVVRSDPAKELTFMHRRSIPRSLLLTSITGLAVAGCAVDMPDGADLPGDDAALGEATQALAGDHLWSKRYGNAADQVAADIATDGTGNVILVGRFTGTWTLGSATLTSAGGADVLVAKIDKGGVPLWARRYGGAGDQEATLVATDASGNPVIHVIGSGPIDFGGGLVSTAGAALVKLDANGNHLWSRNLGATTTDLALDSAGHVLVTGGFAGTVNLGLGALTSVSGEDAFVARLAPGGGTLWNRSYGTYGSQRPRAIAADGAGQVIFGGEFSGELVIGGDTIPSLAGKSTFVAKLDAAGGHLWSQMLPNYSGNSASVGALAVDSAGNVVATGWEGGGSASGRALSVFKLAPDGSSLWSRFFWGTPEEPGDPTGTWHGRQVAMDSNGNVVLTTDGTNVAQTAKLDLGGGPLPAGLIVAQLDAARGGKPDRPRGVPLSRRHVLPPAQAARRRQSRLRSARRLHP